MTASLRILLSKADSNTCESFTRSELKLESVHQESPRSDVFRKRATKPLLNQRQHQKHLTWAVEKKNWTVAQWFKVLFSDESKFSFQGPRVWRKSGEAQNPCCLKSSVKFPQSLMIWAAMSSAGVGPMFSEVHSLVWNLSVVWKQLQSRLQSLRNVTLSNNLIKYENRYSQIFNIGYRELHATYMDFFLFCF